MYYMVLLFRCLSFDVPISSVWQNPSFEHTIYHVRQGIDGQVTSNFQVLNCDAHLSCEFPFLLCTSATEKSPYMTLLDPRASSILIVQFSYFKGCFHVTLDVVYIQLYRLLLCLLRVTQIVQWPFTNDYQESHISTPVASFPGFVNLFPLLQRIDLTSIKCLLSKQIKYIVDQSVVLNFLFVHAC